MKQLRSQVHSLGNLTRLTATTLAFALTACDPGNGGVAPEGLASAVIQGRVQIASTDANLSQAGTDPAGIFVSIEGGLATDVTDGKGEFRLESRGDENRVRLRFRRGDIDVVLLIQGLSPAVVLQIEVRLSPDNVVLLNQDHRGLVEFEGRPELVSNTGEAPARVLSVSVLHSGQAKVVNIYEADTRFEGDGDLLTIDSLLSALAGGANVRIEGDATRADDGTLDAVSIKVETDDDGDGDDQRDDDGDDGLPGLVEFEGRLELVSNTGEAPARVLSVSVLHSGQAKVVNIYEADTRFEGDGDLLTIDSLLSALAGGANVRIEGDATRADDGTLDAVSIKVESDR